MALEVVSDSSVEKDTDLLPELYWHAGVDEYWLVDARREKLVFRIQRRGDAGFIDVEAQDGWIDSGVFQRSFQLTRVNDALGHPEFTLAARPLRNRRSRQDSLET
jgi:Uma2 family endonuclease